MLRRSEAGSLASEDLTQLDRLSDGETDHSHGAGGPEYGDEAEGAEGDPRVLEDDASTGYRDGGRDG